MVPHHSKSDLPLYIAAVRLTMITYEAAMHGMNVYEITTKFDTSFFFSFIDKSIYGLLQRYSGFDPFGIACKTMSFGINFSLRSFRKSIFVETTSKFH